MLLNQEANIKAVDKVTNKYSVRPSLFLYEETLCQSNNPLVHVYYNYKCVYIYLLCFIELVSTINSVTIVKSIYLIYNLISGLGVWFPNSIILCIKVIRHKFCYKSLNKTISLQINSWTIN